ncbi:hypothetical protein [Wukongibacter sp. M2B1]|uniref:hypothetical protein n=1 Tax=Wukongibacter sp. M2B1 TaxID=3088895 RepID=UPI003D799202
MIQDYILVAIFASFPESLLVLLIGFSLCNIRNVDPLKLLLVAAIQTVLSLLIRMSNIYFGIHTIILMVSLYILVVILFKVKYYKAVIPVLIGMLSQGLLQSITLPVISAIFDIDLTYVYYSTESLIFCSIPISALSLVLLMIIRKNRFSLFDIGC